MTDVPTAPLPPPVDTDVLEALAFLAIGQAEPITIDLEEDEIRVYLDGDTFLIEAFDNTSGAYDGEVHVGTLGSHEPPPTLAEYLAAIDLHPDAQERVAEETEMAMRTLHGYAYVAAGEALRALTVPEAAAEPASTPADDLRPPGTTRCKNCGHARRAHHPTLETCACRCEGYVPSPEPLEAEPCAAD